jgi:diguanylate cyclase (GGDEF)-like protein
MPGKPIILVIDDDKITRTLINKTLSEEGFIVIETDNGEEGLKLCQQHLPDIVLLDVVMPGMDGFEVCQKIRSTLDAIKHIPIVMLTGLNDIESINRSYTLGATDFETKPINWTILAHRIKYIFRSTQAFEKLEKSQSILANTQKFAKLASWEIDLNTGKLDCSDVINALLESEPSQPLDKLISLFQYINPDDRSRVWDAFDASCRNGAPLNIIFRINSNKNKNLVFHAQSDGHIKNDRLSGTLQDITEQQRAEERISYLSSYDELTGLPNRTLFKEMVQQALAQAKRHNYMIAGLFMDIDKFQRINDSFGPSVGDRLLILATARLKAAVREGDYLSRFIMEDFYLYRLGGDEFCLMLENIQKIEDVARVAQRLLLAMEAPFQLDEQELFISISIGLVIYPNDCADVDSFMKNGDAAMYSAKQYGRNNYQFYSRDTNLIATKNLSLESHLRRALDNHELILYYQPKIQAHTGALMGVEALLRWAHPDEGMISPMRFIPIAEESGLIIPIGEWVFQEACRQLMTWRVAGIGDFTMAVNLSAKQFRSPNFSKKLAQIISETGIPEDQLEIELTESMLVDNVENAIFIMNELKEQGIKLSIDDFGTGYSSLNYLTRFPLHTLKIDKSFTQEIDEIQSNAAIISAIIAMAKNLNLLVIAEGVETFKQVEWLSKNNCDILQGYYFSAPFPADKMASFYASIKN